jgi:hypothetical protein
MFFIFDFVSAYSQNGFLHEVFGLYAILGFGIGGFHEYVAEFPKSLGGVDHLNCAFYDRCECA